MKFFSVMESKKDNIDNAVQAYFEIEEKKREILLQLQSNRAEAIALQKMSLKGRDDSGKILAKQKKSVDLLEKIEALDNMEEELKKKMLQVLENERVKKLKVVDVKLEKVKESKNLYIGKILKAQALISVLRGFLFNERQAPHFELISHRDEFQKEKTRLESELALDGQELLVSQEHILRTEQQNLKSKTFGYDDVDRLIAEMRSK